MRFNTFATYKRNNSFYIKKMRVSKIMWDSHMIYTDLFRSLKFEE